MFKVYCDTGAYRAELALLEAKGRIRLFQFKYENKNKRIKHKAAPSSPSWKELNYPWKELDDPWDDLGKTSDKRQAIQNLLGPNSLRDAKHLDSAYREGCHAFLTSDKHDISSRRGEISQLLGLRVFHFLDDWNEFLELVETDS